MKTMIPSGMENKSGGRETGSALILSILIMTIMTLLGFSYLLLADTENQIAINERNYAQALYVAEAGVRIVKTWFDNPADPDYLFPNVADTTNIIRSLRMVDDDNNPVTARVAAVQGNLAKPFYRDGTDDLLDKPYRGNMALAFSGSEDGPDLRITGTALDAINDEFFPDFPSPTLRARITRIDLYEPPIFTVGTTRIRYGMATVKVTAGVFLHDGTVNQVQVAERVVKAVLNETPYPGPNGPLQSCKDLATNGDFQVHWGTTQVSTGADINNNLDAKQASGMPWQNQSIRISGANLTQWLTDVAATPLEDPWYGFQAGGAFSGGAPAATQPWPWATPAVNTDHSNLFHNLGANSVACPEMDYDFWKTTAQTGGKNVHYFSFNSGDSLYYRAGDTTGRTIRAWTDGNSTGLGPGLYFFDTATNSVPVDADSNGFADNLAPNVTWMGGTYQVTGFVYMNVGIFGTNGLGGVNATLNPPGEPWVDADLDGLYDNGEVHLNLVYPAAHATGYQIDGVTKTSVSIVDYDTTGADQILPVSFNGVVYNSGKYDAQGNAVYYGSLVAKEGVTGTAGTPSIFFDHRLVDGTFPPAEYELPRVIISSWETDL